MRPEPPPACVATTVTENFPPSNGEMLAVIVNVATRGI